MPLQWVEAERTKCAWAGENGEPMGRDGCRRAASDLERRWAEAEGMAMAGYFGLVTRERGLRFLALLLRLVERRFDEVFFARRLRLPVFSGGGVASPGAAKSSGST